MVNIKYVIGYYDENDCHFAGKFRFFGKVINDDKFIPIRVSQELEWCKQSFCEKDLRFEWFKNCNWRYLSDDEAMVMLI